MVTFRVLGPVEAHAGEHELDLGGLRQRAVLARLLMARGQVVPVDRLINDMWSEDPPPNALAGLQVYISRLRRVLEPNRPKGAPSRLLVTVTSGYALRAAPEDVDAWQFEGLVRTAGQRLDAGDRASARELLETALGLWRGTAYTGFDDTPWAEAEVARMAELRLIASERRADAGLRLGLAAEAVADLEAHTAEHPLREEAWRLLALGLYRTGRQGDALAALRRARTHLAEELGIDPGPALRKLEGDILAQSSELDSPASPPPTPAVAVPQPPIQTEPVEAPQEPFFGRDAELNRLLEATAPQRLSLALISGDAGAGKTTLVQHLATHLAKDGWAIAFGHCPDSSATPPGWAWVEIVRSLVARIGPGEYAAPLAPLLDDAAAPPSSGHLAGGFQLHRAVGGYLAGIARNSPLLVVLEDLHWADDETLAQLRSLPGLLAGSRVFLVSTCRDTEAGVRHADTFATLARLEPIRLNLGGLPRAAVGELIRATCSREVDEEAVAKIAERTGGNAFFVRETARLLEAEGSLTAVSEVPAGVRDVLRRRIARLPPSAQSVLLQAAVIGRDVDVDVLIAVVGDPDEVVDAVEMGLLTGLITEPGTGRLRFDHDLVRETLYGDASLLRRTRLHARAAAAIEQIRPDDVAALAHHYCAAGTSAEKAQRYTSLAAELAERRFAYPEAAALWKLAVQAFDRMPGHTSALLQTATEPGRARERLELMLRLIRAYALAGDMSAARSHRREAMEAALPLADEKLTARVIASLAVPHKGVSRDLGQTAWDIVAATEKALVELPAAEQELRASLLATLALELEGSATSSSRGHEASLEAEELARRTGDPSLLALALSGRLRQSYGIAAVEERESIGRELLEVGASSGQVAVEALGHLVLMECSAARGDFASSDSHVATASSLAERFDLPAPLAVARWYSGQRLMIEGRFDEAARAYRDGARLTAAAGMLEGRQDLPLIATYCLALVQGSVAEMVGPVAEAHARGAKWTLDAYALAVASGGHEADARAIASSRPPVRPDFLYELAMTWRALAGLALDDRARMREAYDTLSPYGDRIAGAGTGVVALWPVAQTLGDLADRLGLAAEPHYRKALEVATRVGVPRWITAAEAAL